MMKREWANPAFKFVPMDLSGLGDVNQLSDAELKIELENRGYQFKKKFQLKDCYLQREIGDSDVLISVGENIADFNGYIELTTGAAFLCRELKEPHTTKELEKALEDEFHIPHKQAVEDVLNFLSELQEKDMVVIS
ncbi:MAG: PqqD family protein [Lachnospiraceae bacterium]|nr:PqqD family protein [Lachnospiraceae bacterium]